jgi:serine/threonine-protein kinase HipA
VKKPSLNVFVADTPAGSLMRSDLEEDTFLFGYAAAAAASDAVSLTMPIRADHYDSMSGLLPIFEMNLPEGSLRERLRRLFAKAVPEFDDLDLLSIVGGSQIGRLRYSQAARVDVAVPEQDLEEILTYEGTADLFAHLLDRFAQHSGISGVQPKVLIREARLPKKITHTGATHIVKAFDPGEFPELAANELICMLGAAAAGIQTARVRLSSNRQFLIVDRFDLASHGAYFGVEDFCVLEGLRAHGRYDGSYERIAMRMTDFLSPSALLRAREQFVLQVAYACAIGNGDAHLKNFAVLYQHADATIELAPAYDIVSTLPYLPRDTLALTMNGSKQFPDRQGLLKFIRTVTHRPERKATELLDRVMTGVNVALRHARSYGRKHRDAAPFVERLSAVMRAGSKRLSGL